MAAADKRDVRRNETSAYQTWLVGEILLLALLGASLALFATYPDLLPAHRLPALRLVLDTAVLLGGAFVAILTTSRFAVEGRRVDLLLAAGFFTVSASTLLFAIAPALDGSPVGRTEAWADVSGRLVGWALIAAAASGRASSPSGTR